MRLLKLCIRWNPLAFVYCFKLSARFLIGQQNFRISFSLTYSFPISVSLSLELWAASKLSHVVCFNYKANINIKCLHMKCKQFCKFRDLLLSSLLFRKHAYGLYCCCLCQQSTNIFYPRKKLMTEDFSSYQKLSKREKKFNKHSVCVQTNFRTHELWSLPWADRRWFKRKHIRIRFCDVTFFLLETFFSVTFAEILTMTDRECLLATSSLFIKSNVVVIMARNVQTKLW